MKIYHLNPERTKVKPPFAGAPFVETSECPDCGDDRLFGDNNRRDEEHDRFTAPAYCYGCQVQRGKLLVVFDTIFGIEEDARIHNGRARVY